MDWNLLAIKPLPTTSLKALFTKNLVHTPQQHGVVERKHKYLLEMAKSLMFQSKLPLRYWGECLLTANYLINRPPSVILNNKFPYKILYGKKTHIFPPQNLWLFMLSYSSLIS